MLILTRKLNQAVIISPHASLDLSTSVGDLFRDGPIEIAVLRFESSQVRLGISAPSSLLVLRDELCEQRAACISAKRWLGVGD
jgi:sRNA-binding carbon storage regulator CsrA